MTGKGEVDQREFNLVDTAERRKQQLACRPSCFTGATAFLIGVRLVRQRIALTGICHDAPIIRAY